MASTPTINFEEVLKPIPGPTPSGKNAREIKDYDSLKEARREEEALSQGEWKRDIKVADWQKVIQISTRILSGDSKDLEVAVWLLEALVKRQGFTGLRDGLRVLRELHTQFWDSFHPVIEDGDREIRTGRLEVLNKLLPPAIKFVPLVVSSGGPGYGYWQYKESQDTENLRRGAASDAEKRRQLDEALKEGKLDGDKFDKAVAATPLAHCSAILEQIVQSGQEFELLEKVLDEKYGEDAPSLRLVKEALNDCQSLMDSLVKKKGGVGLPSGQSAAVGKDVTEGAVSGAPSNGGGSGSGPISDRAGALRQLAAVAEFFQKTEPHSPISYLVQRAAKWGEMPLDEWLQEVIKNPGVLGEVRETLGIKTDKK
jgi:type VI secretion system protein ImpA